MCKSLGFERIADIQGESAGLVQLKRGDEGLGLPYHSARAAFDMGGSC